MKKIFILAVLITLATGSNLFAGNDDKLSASTSVSKATVSGIVIDKITGEVLPGVLVTIGNTDQKTYTDLEGKFEFTSIIPGQYTLTVSYISYSKLEKENLKISGSTNELGSIQLEPLTK